MIEYTLSSIFRNFPFCHPWGGKMVRPNLLLFPFYFLIFVLVQSNCTNLNFSRPEKSKDSESMLSSELACAEAEISAFWQFFHFSALSTRKESLFLFALGAPVLTDSIRLKKLCFRVFQPNRSFWKNTFPIKTFLKFWLFFYFFQKSKVWLFCRKTEV